MDYDLDINKLRDFWFNKDEESSEHRVTKKTKYLAFYDIANPKRLRRIAKTLEGFGYRIQKSVFLLNVTHRKFTTLNQKITKIAEEKEDSFMIFNITYAEPIINFGKNVTKYIDEVIII